MENLVDLLSKHCWSIYEMENGGCEFATVLEALKEASSLFMLTSNNSERMDADVLKWWKYYLNQIPSQHKRIPIFEKVLSVSDSTKSHLVIPKRSKILDFFPNPKDCKNKVVEILIEDEGRKYKFHYAYNKSNSTFILKGAWAEFVKEKGLRVGDTVSLERDETHKYLMTCKRA